MDEDRELYLEAALIWLRSLGLELRAISGMENMLRLGFALGTAERPAEYVPERAVRAAEAAREAAKQYRERQAVDLREANVTELMGQFGGNRLW